ncbi:hypothetical protein E1B28_002748 [Marasmius oreades]|uniref:Uncharacterized protein n=1 Tax=Marasmius oreades TaxID=181124 RepID=A0A9P7RP06_9AGAR|nr:uncharacterized protein E1B28_002748 [Marasmius oreades]KAG7086827.1 hypothetical protein E1B28_002748 [Marasmius oreades]
MFFAPAFVTLSTLTTLAFAATGPPITVPAKDQWWVAQSSNVLTWDCHNSQATQFGVYVTNKDPKVFSGALGIIAILQNDVCSKEITLQQVNLNAGTGYTILFTDPVNQTNILSQSDEFEIKPLGSPYPTPPGSSTGSGTGTGTGTSANSQSTGKNGASSYKSSLGYSFAAVGALVGLIAA